MKRTVKELTIPSIMYLSAILLSIWFLVLQQITIPLSFIGVDSGLSLRFLGAPITFLLFFRYLSLLTKKLLVGVIIEPLSSGLKTLSITSFLYFLSNWSFIPLWIRPITGFMLFASILSSLHNVIVTAVKDINPLFEPVISSLYILFIGYVGSRSWIALYPILETSLQTGFLSSLEPVLVEGLVEPINNIIILSTALTSVFALTGLASNHPNSYLRFLSKTIGENLSHVTLITFSSLYYLFFVRNFLFQYSGINPDFLVVFEWLLICTGFYLGYHNLKSYAEDALILEDVTGTWRKHLQKVETMTDPQLKHLSNLVEGFVDHGLRDELVTNLTLLLDSSGVPHVQISQINGLIIGYQDTPAPRVGFPWQLENHRRYNLQRRKKVINTVLASLQVGPETQILKETLET